MVVLICYPENEVAVKVVAQLLTQIERKECEYNCNFCEHCAAHIRCRRNLNQYFQIVIKYVAV